MKGGISEETAKAVLAFRDERDWKRFHNPKDLAISLSLEAAELLELFQWSGKDLDVPEKRGRMAEELADVLMYALMFADAAGIDADAAVREKLRRNAERYPAALSRGSSAKYTELKRRARASALRADLHEDKARKD
ncbi:MAG: Nucleotide pyrophosphohydrolase [Burkholderia sp.]|jgi:NTP pyrophosphatase (non-canonical NTP hydrolase)